MCILFEFTLLKVVSYYDSSVLSMSVMGFPKNGLDRGVGGYVGCALSSFILDLCYFFLTLQSPLHRLNYIPTFQGLQLNKLHVMRFMFRVTSSTCSTSDHRLGLCNIEQYFVCNYIH